VAIQSVGIGLATGVSPVGAWVRTFRSRVRRSPGRIHLGDGRFAIVHTSSQGRGARDVRLVFANGTSGTADAASDHWLTTNEGTTHAPMLKVEQLGDYLLVTYALWDSMKGHQLAWQATLLDAKGRHRRSAQTVPDVEVVDAAPLFRFKGGSNAGSVGWVSDNAARTMSIRVASPGY
jgi:hypothetical protein